MIRRRTTLALVAATALTLTACSAAPTPTTPTTPEQSATTAASDAKVVLYSGRNEKLVQPLLDRFTADTGITVEVRYSGTAELAAQLVEEGGRTPAHVFLAQDAGALGAMAKAGAAATLPQATLDQVPAHYRAKDGSWVGVTGRARVLAYDARVVTSDQLPASVFDLVKPEWKGKVGIAPTNASFQSFVTAMAVAEGEAKTAAFLRDLAANDPQIREKNGVIVSDIEAGRLPVGLVNHYYLYEKASEAGVPADQLNVKLHFFGHGDLGGLVNVSGVALTKNQPDADGQTLVDYLLSKPAQEYFATKTHEYPLVAGVSSAPGLPALDSLEAPKVDLNDLDRLAESVALIKQAGLA